MQDQPAKKYGKIKKLNRQEIGFWQRNCIAKLWNTNQRRGYFWVTRKIYADITTHITSSWRFITTKEDRYASRVNLWAHMYCGIFSQVMEKPYVEIICAVTVRDKPGHAWSGEPVVFLSQSVCLGNQQSESLQPAILIAQWDISITEWGLPQMKLTSSICKHKPWFHFSAQQENRAALNTVLPP